MLRPRASFSHEDFFLFYGALHGLHITHKPTTILLVNVYFFNSANLRRVNKQERLNQIQRCDKKSKESIEPV